MEWKVDIASLVAVITAAIALWRAIKMTSHEEAASDAGVVKSYAEAAERASARANYLSQKLDELEKRIDAIGTENERLLHENQEYLGILTNWAEGITLLLMQVKANQLTAAWIPDQEVIENFRAKGKKKK